MRYSPENSDFDVEIRKGVSLLLKSSVFDAVEITPQGRAEAKVSCSLTNSHRVFNNLFVQLAQIFFLPYAQILLIIFYTYCIVYIGPADVAQPPEEVSMIFVRIIMQALSYRR